MRILISLTVLALVVAVPVLAEDTATAPNSNLPIATGIFKPSDESLKQYRYPDWFRDAKFGIWAHWGPQAVPRQGDWYARKLYEHDAIDRRTGKRRARARTTSTTWRIMGIPRSSATKTLFRFGRRRNGNPRSSWPSTRRRAPKYFVSMGSHHDNFFLWNSKIHRWNAVNMGPKKDVVGLWQKAAKKEGLRFGVSEHLGASYTWFQASHGADKTGPMAGVPYDGNDPQYQDLYHGKAAANDTGWLTNNPVWQREWFDSIKELIDNYQPDLLYSDSPMPFGNVGRSMLAHFYNQDMAKNGDKLEAVYNCKQNSQGKWRSSNGNRTVDAW